MPRLFFALWPDDGPRRCINTYLNSMSTGIGRRVAAENYHITLAFLGSVSSDCCERLITQASTIKGQGFQLILDRVGCWKKSHTVWMAPTFVPDELNNLVDQINKIAMSCNVIMDSRRFKPHLTLMRKVKKSIPETPIQAIDWKVNSFALIESVTDPEGVRYTERQSWPLT